MNLLKTKITNKENELLDVWIEGNLKSQKTVILVHGLAANKHYDYFDTVAVELGKDYRVIRFDFSGCGESQGQLEEKDLLKWSEDLEVVINYVKNNFSEKLFIIAHSMGVFVTALTNPKNIIKTVFTGVPNSNIDYLIDIITKSILSRKQGKINYKGISIFPRSLGAIQKIGPSFWKVLSSFNPVKNITKYSKTTDLFMFHMNQDQVIGKNFLDEYSTIPNIKIKWLDGDHSFTKPKDRKILIEEIKDFFKKDTP